MSHTAVSHCIITSKGLCQHKIAFLDAGMNIKVEKCGVVPITLMEVEQQQKMRLFQKKNEGW